MTTTLWGVVKWVGSGCWRGGADDEVGDVLYSAAAPGIHVQQPKDSAVEQGPVWWGDDGVEREGEATMGWSNYEIRFGFLEVNVFILGM